MYLLKDYFSLYAFGMVCITLTVSFVSQYVCKNSSKIRDLITKKDDREMERNSLR
jgi:hypothetical protein